MKIFEDVNMQGRHIRNCPDLSKFDDDTISTEHGWSSAKIQSILDRIIELLPGSEQFVVVKAISDGQSDTLLDSSGDSILGRLVYQRL